MGKLSSLILNSDQVKKKLERIAFQIIEEYHNEKELFIVGISNNGFLLAKKLKDLIQKNKLISEVILIELKINKKQPLDK
jgi:pyrimidine operon attenuation protein/uracil phosphoribosyltransferase